MAMDASPAVELMKVTKRLMRNWVRVFEEEAARIAKWFGQQEARYNRNAVEQNIKGNPNLDFLTVNFKHKSPAEKQMTDVIIASNVALIKTIPERYFGEVEWLVQESVRRGRDLKALSDELEGRYNLTRRRAAMIARDQNDKATEALHRARMLEMGITKAVWMHTSAGKTYRKSHIAMNGKEFDLREGLYDPEVKRKIFPGELINCKCTCRPVIEFNKQK